jgi:hypothetical protein
MEQGIPGLEAMAGYEDRYLFVEVNSGTNLKALEQWRSGFSVSQDFAQMVSSRVRSRLIDAAGNPDRIYGRYFEGLIKTISDSNYSGVRRETDFWLFKRYFAEDGETIDREVYEYYILVSINKSILEEQIDLILRQVQIQTDSTREQTAAIERLRENFYEGF